MNLAKFAKLVAFGLIVIAAVTGCKKRPTPLTLLPGSRAGGIAGPGPGSMIDPGGTTGTDGVTGVAGVPLDGSEGIALGDGHDNWIPNAEIFRNDTVYFDFDSSVVKQSEQDKVANVASYLKANPVAAVRVEGHCDERGTEEYNRALGERRALAAREELVRQGIDPSRVDIISFGKDRPADPSHNEAAYRLNRRAEFILLTPPSS